MTAFVSLAEQSHSLLLVLLIVLHLVRLPGGGLLQQLVAPHQHLLHVVLGGHGEVRVVGSRPELVTRHDEEDQRGELLEHWVQPLVLKEERNYIFGWIFFVPLTWKGTVILRR